MDRNKPNLGEYAKIRREFLERKTYGRSITIDSFDKVVENAINFRGEALNFTLKDLNDFRDISLKQDRDPNDSRFVGDMINILSRGNINDATQHSVLTNVLNRFGNKDLAQAALNSIGHAVDGFGHDVKFMADAGFLMHKQHVNRNLYALNNLLRDFPVPTDFTYTNQTPQVPTVKPMFNEIGGLGRQREQLYGIVTQHDILNVLKQSSYENKPSPGLNVIDAVNASRFLPVSTKDNILRLQGGSMWSHLTSPSNYLPYQKDRSLPAQAELEKIMNFASFANDSKNHPIKSQYSAMDIETIGNHKWDGKTDGGFFHVSEIAIAKFKQIDGKYREVKEDAFTKILKPTNQTKSTIEGLIQQLQKNPNLFAGFDETTRLSLVNLTRYSTQGIRENAFLERFKARTGKDFKGANYLGGGNVIHSNLHENIFTGKVMDQDEVIRNFDIYGSRMMDGLRQLEAKGDNPLEVLQEYNQELEKNKALTMFTHNGENFDIPGLNNFGSLVGQSVANPKNHIDWMRVNSIVYSDPVAMHFAKNPNRPQNFEEGPLSLHEYRRTLGYATDESHAGYYDVGERGLGGVIGEMLDPLMKDINAAGGPGAFYTTMKFNTKEITKGQTMFAPAGVINYNPDAGFSDFQAVLNKDGKFEVYSPDFNQVVVNADTFYDVQGIRRLGKKEEQKYALQLYDEYNERYSFIVRQGEDARAQLAEFMQKSFIDPASLGNADKDLINARVLDDRARRRYSGLFGMRQGWTKGFGAAERIFNNIGVLVNNPNMSYDDWITNEAVDFKSLHPGGDVKGSRSDIALFNEKEASEVWAMKDRLMSEHPIMSQAIERINSQFEGTELEHAQRRSLALQRVATGVDNAAGEPIQMLTALEHEKKAFKFRDGLIGRERTINFTNMDTAMRGMLSYMYERNPYDDQERKTNYANTRLMAFMDTLKSRMNTATEEGKMAVNEIDSMIQLHNTRELNKRPMATAQSVAQWLNEQDITIQETIKVQSLQRRQLDLANADEIINTAINETNSLAGQIEKGKERAAILIHHGEMGKVLSQLDKLESNIPGVPNLNRNNRLAVERVVNTILNDRKYNDIDVALTMTKDQSEVGIHLFNRDQGLSVIGQLNQGVQPDNAVKISMPLIQENGTLTYGNQVLNARNYYIDDNGQKRLVSATERLAYGYQNILTSTKENINIAEAIKEGRFSDAAGTLNWMERKQLDSLSGIKRNLGRSDRNFWQNTISDLLKQREIDFVPAILKDLVDAGHLAIGEKYTDTDDKIPNAISNKDVLFNGNNVDKFVSMDDLTSDAQDMIRRMLPAWLEQQGLGDMFLSGVKSDKAEQGIYTGIDARNLTPFGHLTNQNRDNPVQAQNVYLMGEADQKRILGAAGSSDIYANFDDMTTTRTFQGLLDEKAGGESVRDFKTGVNVKVAYMSQQDIERRMKELIDNPETRDMLHEMGYLYEDKDGKLKIDEIRMPNVYEQQAVMSGRLQRAFRINEVKTLNLNEFEFAKRFDTTKLDNGDLLMNVSAGEEIGRYKGQVIRMGEYDGQLRLTADGSKAIMTRPQKAHKFFLDIEKFTPGGGQGFGGIHQKLIELLTGDKEIGVIYGPDIKKHQDFGAILRAQSNLIVDKLNRTKDKAEQLDIINKVESAGLGLVAEQNANGKYSFFDESNKILTGQEITASTVREFSTKMDNLLDSVGIKDATSAGVKIGIQTLSAAQVYDYSGAIGDEVFDKETGDVEGVRYGSRELDVIRRKGGDAIFNTIFAEMMKQGEKVRKPGETSKLTEALGMMDAVKYFGGKLDSDIPTLSPSQFANLPETDKSSRSAHLNTILDDKYARDLTGYNPKTSKVHGYLLELPELQYANGEAMEYKHGNKVFIPYLKQQGTDTDVWKKEMQRTIAQIFEQSSKLEQYKRMGGSSKYHEQMKTAHNQLNELIGDYQGQLAKHVTSSKGQVFSDLLKVNMPNSHSGITKIITPERSAEIQTKGVIDDAVYINERTAHAMGIWHDIADAQKDGKDFYGLSLRYPTFHSEAQQAVKIRIDNTVGDNEQFLTAGMASLERADSDGDYNHLVALKQNQEDLQKMYDNQLQERAGRHGIAYQKAAYAAEMSDDEFKRQLSKSVYKAELADYYKPEKELNFDLGAFANDPEFASFRANSDAEVLAKSGKTVVGMASDINSKLRMITRDYIADEDKARKVLMFGEGIEQKLISAKHGMSNAQLEAMGQEILPGKYYAKTGALEFIQALQRSDWDKAIQIDQSMLGSLFSDKFGLKEVQGIMREHMTDKFLNSRMRSRETGVGLSSGVRTTDMTELANILMGEQDGTSSSTPLDLLYMTDQYGHGLDATGRPDIQEHLQNIRNGQAKEVPLSGRSTLYDSPSTTYERTRRSDIYPNTIDQSKRPDTGYIERGISQAFNNLTETMGGRSGIIMGGAAVLGGLALVNLTGANNITPESMPHNSGNHDNVPMPEGDATGQRTVRVQNNSSNQSGMNVRVSGTMPSAMSNYDAGNLAGQALQSSGIQASINVRSQDDTSSIDSQWLQDRFSQLLTNGYVSE